MKNILDLFSFKSTANNTTNTQNETKKSVDILQNDTFIDIILQLNTNFEVGVKLFFDDKIENKNLTDVEYAIVCAEFLHYVISGKLKNQVLEILFQQIKNTNNKKLLDNIEKYLTILGSTVDSTDNLPMIKPSQAFNRYKNG